MKRFNEITKKVIDNILLNDTQYRDTKVYDKVRFWRTINSIHSETGVYKIPLIHAELGIPIDKIKEMAKGPRPIPSPPSIKPVDTLVKVWLKAKEEIYSQSIIQPEIFNSGTPPEGSRFATGGH